MRNTSNHHLSTERLQTLRGTLHRLHSITPRERRTQIRSTLAKRADNFDIILDDVSITHLVFGKEFSGAIEQKQVAQQEAERARFIVDKAMQEKRSVVIKAQGEAQSARLIGAAIRDNPGFIQLRKLEAAREIAGTLSKSTNRLYLDGSSLLLDVQDRSDVDLVAHGKAGGKSPVAAAVTAPPS